MGEIGVGRGSSIGARRGFTGEGVRARSLEQRWRHRGIVLMARTRFDFRLSVFVVLTEYGIVMVDALN